MIEPATPGILDLADEHFMAARRRGGLLGSDEAIEWLQYASSTS